MKVCRAVLYPAIMWLAVFHTPLMPALSAMYEVHGVKQEDIYQVAAESYYAWIIACTTAGFNCVGVKMPDVHIFNGLVWRSEWFTSDEWVIVKLEAVRGAYYGDNNVWISKYLKPGSDRVSTMIHEMVHYLQIQVRHEGSFPKDPCPLEAEAFAVTDKWWRAIGEPTKQRGPTWWRPYPRCQNYSG